MNVADIVGFIEEGVTQEEEGRENEAASVKEEETVSV
jgi:hypothetical protein